jgi:hypothetical protein
MSNAISFRCPGCNARIKASAELLGEKRHCPGCNTPFVVRISTPPDNGPMLVRDGDTVRLIASV